MISAQTLMSRTLGVVATIATLAWLTGCAQPHRQALDSIIEPSQLADRLAARAAAGRPIVLDVRDAAAYDAGHVEGAIRVDPTDWKNDSLARYTGLDHDAVWRKRIGAVGVSGAAPVVIYDDGRMTEAARVWFIFQHFGVPDAAVLDGGYRALKPLLASGAMRESNKPTAAPAVDFRPRTGAGRKIALVDREAVRRAIDRHEAQIFDARTVDEYVGKDLRRNPRGGHLPTAVNLPHSQLLDEQGRLKSPDELARLFERVGLKRGRPLITHCESGGRASLAALAAQRAGYGPVLNYYLSFGDWAADATCPVEKP